MTRWFVWIPVALLIGLIAGSLGPRSELRAARKEIDRLRLAVREGDRRKSHIEDVSRILQIPETVRESPGVQRAVSHRVVTTNSPAAARSVEADTNRHPHSFSFRLGRAGGGEGGAPGADDGDGSMKRRIDEAVELWRVRSDIARSTFIANTGLTAEQATQFDTLVASMNLRLRERIGAWADHLAQTNTAGVGPESGIRMANDLTDVLVLTYDEMDRTMPAGWRARAGERVNIADFIDPSVAEPLIGVEDKLRDSRPGRRGGDPLEDDE